MHRFDYRFLSESVPAELASVTNLIYDLRARNDIRLNGDPYMRESLRQVAIVESVRGSNAIEGIVTSRARLKELIVGDAPPLEHGERELIGYRGALQEMYDPSFSAELSEDYIRHLHALLFQASSERAGKYKVANNWIQERGPDGRISVRFVPVDAKDVPDAMEQIVMAYREGMQKSAIDRMALIACFTVDFLCIHPFMDGNGRVSRLLTSMLLMQAGFDIGRFVSIEGMIDRYKAGYYEALAASSIGWHENESDYTPFMVYLLQILYACYRELDKRYAERSAAHVPKGKRVEAVLMGSYVPVSKADLCEQLPEVSVRTVERVLGKLVKEGKIEKIGTYRDARYRRA